MSDIKQQLEKIKTKSDKIRFLSAEGWERSAIAKELGIRYQHVRNVLVGTKTTKAQPTMPLLQKIYKIAETEGVPPQQLIDEALSDLIEKKRKGGVRPNVLEAYRQSLKEFDVLYSKLAQ